MKVSELKIGSKIEFGSYPYLYFCGRPGFRADYTTPITWIKVDDGLFMSEQCVTLLSFEGSDYESSLIKEWLTSDEEGVEGLRSIIGYSWKVPGFLHFFEENETSAIISIDIPSEHNMFGDGKLKYFKRHGIRPYSHDRKGYDTMMLSDTTISNGFYKYRVIGRDAYLAYNYSSNSAGVRPLLELDPEAELYVTERGTMKVKSVRTVAHVKTEVMSIETLEAFLGF